jgi:hypothetical protein
LAESYANEAAYKGEIFGFAPTNQPTHVEGMTIIHFSNEGNRW